MIDWRWKWVYLCVFLCKIRCFFRGHKWEELFNPDDMFYYTHLCTDCWKFKRDKK